MKINPEKFKDVKILVVGDIMLDEYVSGEANRISPEAPVAVILNPNTKFVLGGAGNVLANVASLGAQARIFGVIGNDIYGDTVKNEIGKICATQAGLIRIPGRPTIRKRRIVANGQQVVRIDFECTDEIDPREHETALGILYSNIKWANLVIVSDYAKGLITGCMMGDIRSLCSEQNTEFIVDPKGDDFSKYAGSYVITPNEKEIKGQNLQELIKYGSILRTDGPRGMVLFQKKYRTIRISAESRATSDVSGAGDTVIAALGVALAAGYDLEDSARFANSCAGIVVGKPGTATVTLEDLMVTDKPFDENKIMTEFMKKECH